MQKIFKLMENLKTHLAVDEEELKQLEKQINSYTEVGDEEYEQDKQVSESEGEAKSQGQRQFEHHSNSAEHPNEGKSEHEAAQNVRLALAINPRIPRVNVTHSSPPDGHVKIQTKSAQPNRGAKDENTPFHDDFFGPRFGLHDQIRKTLDCQRRQEFQKYLNSKQQIKSESVKVSHSKSNTPLKSTGARENLFNQCSSMPRQQSTLNLIDESIDRDSEKRTQASNFQARYKEELAQQISEKQRLLAEARERERIDEEKLNQRVARQRRLMKQEYEDEIQRVKRASLSQPDLTSIGKPLRTTRSEITSPSYLQLREVALSRRSEAPAPLVKSKSRVDDYSGTICNREASNLAATEMDDSWGSKVLLRSVKMNELPAQATFKSSEAARKVIPLIPNVKKNLAHQQHRLLVKLAGATKQTLQLPLKRSPAKGIARNAL